MQWFPRLWHRSCPRVESWKTLWCLVWWGCVTVTLVSAPSRRQRRETLKIKKASDAASGLTAACRGVKLLRCSLFSHFFKHFFDSWNKHNVTQERSLIGVWSRGITTTAHISCVLSTHVNLCTFGLTQACKQPKKKVYSVYYLTLWLCWIICCESWHLPWHLVVSLNGEVSSSVFLESCTACVGMWTVNR